ncbi:trypsin-like peptidase domain-containing protein [Turneriella parva]|uniref:Peptidase S1 and S6 chymotrypsin/Hap n=1 Tax=Turneriella parva (strain ATCC BAA-1111 / DSM 21527 / NCTC 11395 / H) TaxID=869212 RepID=I4B4P6_TURPD|nr:trypsin-like peptidase domain-containing protein [Turneriella parva]AFM12253.1 peptidase S1 and S6 chymotrypsin/Hap [Turneriella parva DSM 21527]
MFRKINQRRFRLSALGVANFTLFVFLMGVAFSPFAGTCTGGGSVAEAGTDNPLLKSDAVQHVLKFQEAIREIYKEVNPAVIRIETEQTVEINHPFFNDPMFRRFFQVPEGQQKQKRAGLGSGFIISSDGFAVTNHHVVQKVDKITVKLTNGKEYTAKLIGSDPNSDIALIKIDGAKGLKTAHLGDSDKIEVGDISLAIGNPFGLQSTLTTGIISSKGQDVNSADGVSRIQTDASINPGNSGGPLLNVRGEVIGINQMIYSQSGGSVGIGFAIPINHAKHVIEKLKAGKKIRQGYIGVSVDPEQTDEKLNLLGVKGKTGLIVAQVVIGSPAFKAGIVANDFITHIDGKPAEKFSVLKSAVLQKGVGANIEVKLIRQGKEVTVSVKVAEAPQQQQ